AALVNDSGGESVDQVGEMRGLCHGRERKKRDNNESSLDEQSLAAQSDQHGERSDGSSQHARARQRNVEKDAGNSQRNCVTVLFRAGGGYEESPQEKWDEDTPDNRPKRVGISPDRHSSCIGESGHVGDDFTAPQQAQHEGHFAASESQA